jgi:HSP20 family protein
VESGVLTLEGDRPPDLDSRRADHLRVERSHGSFSRTFHLPGPVDDGRVTAHFHLGVLEVFVPKTPGVPGGSIRVTVS